MKSPIRIRYFSTPHEGRKSAAASRPALAALSHLIDPEGAEPAALPSLLQLQGLRLFDPSAADALTRAQQEGTLGGALLYADAGDCLGDGELLVRSLLLADAGKGHTPLTVASALPAAMPQLLCHFGVTEVYAIGKNARIDHPVCRENANAVTWQTPDGSACLLRLPSSCTETKVAPGLGTATYSQDEPIPCEGALCIDRANAEDATALLDRTAADLILRVLEPLAALVARADNATTDLRPTLDRLTRTLLENLSVTDTASLSPAVLRHRTDRISSVIEEGEALLSTLLQAFLPSTPQSGTLAALAIFSPYTQKTALSVTCTLSLSDVIENFALQKEDGHPIKWECLSAETENGCRKWRIRLLLPNAEPLAVTRVFVISAPPCVAKASKNAALRIENRGFVCEVADGRLRVLCRKSGRTLQNPFFLEDQGDRGAQCFSAAQEGSLLFFPVNWRRQGSRLAPTLVADIPMELPCTYHHATDERSAETCRTIAQLTLTAEAESELLRVSLSFTDPAEAHRLRLAVRTELICGRLTVDAPFGAAVTERSDAFPAFFARIAEEDAAVALLTDTRRPVERVNDTLYVTLSHRAPYRTETARTTEASFALADGRELHVHELYESARRNRILPPVAVMTELPCPSAVTSALPPAALPLSYSGADILLTTLRRRTEGKDTVLHFLNTADETRELRLTARAPLALSTLAEREELPLSEGGGLRIPLAPRQLLALILKCP